MYKTSPLFNLMILEASGSDAVDEVVAAAVVLMASAGCVAPTSRSRSVDSSYPCVPELSGSAGSSSAV